ncbi:zinc ribbon domain-containing protein [Okeania sp. SIO2B3]|uniref:zinc ribbon domain-containing protein n=1 Tax=Okeania sp. SIO2B3 TaxID=2607784 RepID=UPI0035C8F8D2
MFYKYSFLSFLLILFLDFFWHFKIREWDCPECAAHHDRDVNASINILAAGLAVSAPVAHGGNPQDRAGLSVERAFRSEGSKSRKAGATLAQLLCQEAAENPYQ